MNNPEAGAPNVEEVPVVVIGAGQAGLSISWHLAQRGIAHVVLERDTIAHEWRDGRWDNFTLVTPNWQCNLPGYEYSGDDPNGFMTRDQVYAWVRDYARTFDAPVREHVSVTSVSQCAGGGFDVLTTAGPFRADHVVVAVGGYHTPVIPRFAEKLPDRIAQVHSSQYRGADRLPDGAVLVVGSGQSGAQIAEDLHLAGRKVHLATGSAPRVARFYRGRDCVAWLHDMGVYDVSISEHPGGLSKREKTNHYVTGRDGGRDIDLRGFAREGMQLHGRSTGLVGTTMTFAPNLAKNLAAADAVSDAIKDDIDAYIDRAGIDAPTEQRYVPVWTPEAEVTELDLATTDISAIVWSIGFRTDYRFLKVGVFDGEGMPTHTRGVTSAPGVYFLGLPWQHTWGSGRFAAIARDAEYLADQVIAGCVPSAQARSSH
ncbi:MSMEG_0569 family flavin-dependent oxidoreductase [Williamsia sp.]|uniref:MSMEG_0569 family flavin-dependent oxidoreductase n=1 Tax=Williamsia sp. TaxID=1872085 RepID=UPI002F94E282